MSVPLSNVLLKPKSHMSFSNAKGLLNGPGENNCFLNSAVQVLWHLDVFRRSFRELSGHACMGDSCIFCAVKVIFTQFQYSEKSALPPNSLRKAMAETFHDQRRFQLGFMDDAAECFENILQRIHLHVAVDEDEDRCAAPHCIPHRKFAMTLVEQVACGGCGAVSEPLPFTQLVHYVSVSAICAQTGRERKGGAARKNNFGLLLRMASAMGDARDCPVNCGARNEILRLLVNLPEVVSVGLVWDTTNPSTEQISTLLNVIGTSIFLPDLFELKSASADAHQMSLRLVGVVTYYGKHYSTFFLHGRLKFWIYFDDATVKEIGCWPDVINKCVKGHYQPLLLLYANPNSTVINTDYALKTTTIVQGPNSIKPTPAHPARPSSTSTRGGSFDLMAKVDNEHLDEERTVNVRPKVKTKKQHQRSSKTKEEASDREPENLRERRRSKTPVPESNHPDDRLDPGLYADSKNRAKYRSVGSCDAEKYKQFYQQQKREAGGEISLNPTNQQRSLTRRNSSKSYNEYVNSNDHEFALAPHEVYSQKLAVPLTLNTSHTQSSIETEFSSIKDQSPKPYNHTKMEFTLPMSPQPLNKKNKSTKDMSIVKSDASCKELETDSYSRHEKTSNNECEYVNQENICFQPSNRHDRTQGKIEIKSESKNSNAGNHDQVDSAKGRQFSLSSRESEKAKGAGNYIDFKDNVDDIDFSALPPPFDCQDEKLGITIRRRSLEEAFGYDNQLHQTSVVQSPDFTDNCRADKDHVDGYQYEVPVKNSSNFMSHVKEWTSNDNVDTTLGTTSSSNDQPNYISQRQVESILVYQQMTRLNITPPLAPLNPPNASVSSYSSSSSLDSYHHKDNFLHFKKPSNSNLMAKLPAKPSLGGDKLSLDSSYHSDESGVSGPNFLNHGSQHTGFARDRNSGTSSSCASVSIESTNTEPTYHNPLKSHPRKTQASQDTKVNYLSNRENMSFGNPSASYSPNPSGTDSDTNRSSVDITPTNHHSVLTAKQQLNPDSVHSRLHETNLDSENKCENIISESEDLLARSLRKEAEGDLASSLCLCLSAVTCLKKALELPHLNPKTLAVATGKRNAAIQRTKRLHQTMLSQGTEANSADPNKHETGQKLQPLHVDIPKTSYSKSSSFRLSKQKITTPSSMQSSMSSVSNVRKNIVNSEIASSLIHSRPSNPRNHGKKEHMRRIASSSNIHQGTNYGNGSKGDDFKEGPVLQQTRSQGSLNHIADSQPKSGIDERKSIDDLSTGSSSTIDIYATLPKHRKKRSDKMRRESEESDNKNLDTYEPKRFSEVNYDYPPSHGHCSDEFQRESLTNVSSSIDKNNPSRKGKISKEEIKKLLIDDMLQRQGMQPVKPVPKNDNGNQVPIDRDSCQNSNNCDISNDFQPMCNKSYPKEKPNVKPNQNLRSQNDSSQLTNEQSTSSNPQLPIIDQLNSLQQQLLQIQNLHPELSLSVDNFKLTQGDAINLQGQIQSLQNQLYQIGNQLHSTFFMQQKESQLPSSYSTMTQDKHHQNLSSAQNCDAYQHSNDQTELNAPQESQLTSLELGKYCLKTGKTVLTVNPFHSDAIINHNMVEESVYEKKIPCLSRSNELTTQTSNDPTPSRHPLSHPHQTHTSRYSPSEITTSPRVNPLDLESSAIQANNSSSQKRCNNQDKCTFPSTSHEQTVTTVVASSNSSRDPNPPIFCTLPRRKTPELDTEREAANRGNAKGRRPCNTSSPKKSVTFAEHISMLPTSARSGGAAGADDFAEMPSRTTDAKGFAHDEQISRSLCSLCGKTPVDAGVTYCANCSTYLQRLNGKSSM